MDEFYGGKPAGSSTGKKLVSALLVLAIMAVTAFSAIGIYKLSTEKRTATQPAASEVSGGNAAGSSGTAGGTVNISGYDLDIVPSQVAAKVIPSVVCIQNYQQSQSQLPFAQTLSGEEQLTLAAEGSGIVYTEDGYIITNAHVVENSSLLKVVLNNEEVYEAKLIGSDADTDLALLKIEATGLTPIEIGDYDALAVGDFVMAVGNPGGMEFSSSVTFGIVSAKDRPMDIDGGYTMNTIQTDAAINPGNSGGALVNMDGKLVGINSAKYVATGYEGLGFSITVEEALPIVESLKEYGEVKGRSRLGVTGMIIDELVANRYGLTPGFYVNEVTNENAGTLKAGDVITAVDGAEVSSESDIKNALQKKQAGDSVTIKYWRSGAQQETQLVLISADADETP
ncbi:MAG: trypsin-like peptidase domain-containing protein [Christensenellaceae bacterium]